MEFLDEDARPRFLLQSKPSPSQSNLPETHQIHPFHKPTIFFSFSLAAIFLALSFLYFTSEPLNSIFIWLSVSLLVGPFAPASLTAGDIRVGLGPPLEDPVKEIETKSDDNNRRVGRKATKFSRKPDDPISRSDFYGSDHAVSGADGNEISINRNGSSTKLGKDQSNEGFEEGDWIEGEDELLKKLMGKHPVGKPGRWEAIAEGFKGRHSVESVIKRSKEMGEKKVNDDDSYSKFLKNRKAVDKRVEDENEVNNGGGGLENVEVKGGEEGNGGWSTGEDLALLNALKAFPKDTAMRWEKVAAAVPGKTKAACLKRVNELKKDFRGSKA